MRCIYWMLPVALAAGPLLSGCSPSPSRVQVEGPSPYGQEGIRVSGTAVVRADPDLAVFTIGCITTSTRAGTARTQNDAVMQRVLAALRSAGIANRDVQTIEYQLGEAWEERRHVWRLSNTVEVRVRDVGRAADVIDAAADAGANQIGSVRYEVESLHTLRAKARKEAARVAREKAEQLAALMGVRLGKAVAISDTTNTPYSPWGWGNRNANVVAQSVTQQAVPAADAQQPDDQLASGRVAVTAREEMVFAIVP